MSAGSTDAWPSFTIVTCTWNSIAFLGECIRSVREQDYPHVEQVFVDGGSTDGTLELIRSAAEGSRWVTDVRGGISNAMNEGIRMARNDIVAHLHSDDYYPSPDVLSRVAEAFRRRPDAMWLFGRCLTVRDGVELRNEYASKPCSWHAMIRRNLVPHPATFVRRSAFEQVGLFDTNLKYAMDYDLWLRLMAMGAPIQLEDYLAAFREHGGSLSTRHAGAAAREDLRVRMRHVRGGLLERLEHLGRFAIRQLR